MDHSNTQPKSEVLFDRASMTTLQKAGELLFKLRDYTPVPLVILALLFAQPTAVSIICGLFLALFGELIRAYGVAFIGTISRTRSYSNGELVSSGPFALLRNPLYFGNLLLTLGLAVMSGILWLPLLVVVFFYSQYIPIVAWEEMKLNTIFGPKYQEYCRKVPNRWFPSLVPLLQGAWMKEACDWGPAWKSEKRTLTSVISYLVIMLAYFIGSQYFGVVSLPLISLN